ncbi:ABC transporter substrate-binding protein/permease [Lacticaseibacillus baoqingensis]|uniref:ABC transporter substrate-binding protein/permease n=1 Tax=Lacticaseibacillus baoqingensis TaxID=2486013 RepID=A0ABW4E5B1_9LACO|nr:ABC transporter substrate-binding protein/permease [Lacticaseibacillus baoqingensis]
MKLKWHLIALIALILCLVGVSTTPVHAAGDDSLAKVKAKGTLVMGNSPNYPPYEFTVNENGKEKIVGMDIELGQQIAKDLGVKLVIKKMSFDSLLVALETGKVDMILSGFSPTATRKQHVDFSNNYYVSKQYIILNKTERGYYKNRRSFTGKRVGAVLGSTAANLVKQQMPGAKLVTMENASDLVLALKAHKIDGIVKDSASAIAYAQSDATLAAIDGKFSVSSAEAGNAIALPKGADSLRLAVNQSIAKVQQKDLFNKVYLKDAGKEIAKTNATKSMWHYWPYFAKGVGYTVGISLVAVIIGMLLGALIALIRLGHVKVFKAIFTAYVEFVRGTPLMVQVMFIYFGIGMFYNISAVVAGTLAVGLNSAAYVSEVFRGGIESIAKGQTEAARSLGLSQHDTMRYVVLPQAITSIWPALGNEFISLIKETSIVSIIGVADLIYQLRVVQADTYSGVLPIAIAMVLYFIMTFSLSRLLRHFEKKMHHA